MKFFEQKVVRKGKEVVVLFVEKEAGGCTVVEEVKADSPEHAQFVAQKKKAEKVAAPKAPVVVPEEPAKEGFFSKKKKAEK